MRPGKQWIWRGGLAPLRLGVVEDLVDGYAADGPGASRMTNGAAMLAAAIAMGMLLAFTRDRRDDVDGLRKPL